jgi:flavin reductase (DIM6/NTAB) family NADH-FMN oxidoreductase RutF
LEPGTTGARISRPACLHSTARSIRPGGAAGTAVVGAAIEVGLENPQALDLEARVPVEREQFFALMASFASSVTVITSKGQDGVMRGLTASAFCSVSLDPRLCLVSVDNRSESIGAIAESGTFVVNILASDQEEISRRFASKLPDKFEGIPYRLGPETDAPILDGVVAWIECRVHEAVPAGDHTFFIGEILDGTANEGLPLLYFRGQYRQLG